jgi:hypothetical protein
MTTTNSKTSWKEYFDFRFLYAEDLKGKEWTLTITEHSGEQVWDQWQRKTVNDKLSLHFAETKKMLGLNKTNSRKLQQIFGTENPSEWRGKITIYPTAEKVKGEIMDVIRIKKAKETN